MNVSIPPGPEGHTGGASGPAESDAPDAVGADPGEGMGNLGSGEPPEAIPDEEYEPL